MSDMSDTIPECAAHQEPTRITCVECGDPICPRCMVRTDVGIKCLVHGAPTATPEPGASPRRRLTPGVLLLGGVVALAAVAVLLFLLLDGGEAPVARTDPVGTWSVIDEPEAVRGTATVTPLGDGTLLAAGGGVSAIALDTTARFDPASGDWTPGTPLAEARRGHAAVALGDGRVLVTGGVAEGGLLASTEIFDPASGGWETVGSMTAPRVGHSLSLLPDGRVLTVGGSSSGPTGSGGGQAIAPVATAEIFDPATGAWAPTSDLSSARFEHTATTLDDGRILIVGGLGPGDEPGLFVPLASTELFDPAAEVFVTGGSLGEARANHAAALLDDGRVVVVGGVGGPTGDGALASSELFDPRRGGWAVAPALRVARTGATATRLGDGTVLVAGGESRDGGARRSLTSAERLNVDAGVWLDAGDMTCARSEHAAAIAAGAVLLVAGDGAFPGEPPVAQSCVDRYEP